MTRPEFDAWAILKARGVRTLLSDPTDNPKLKKSLGVNAMTAPLHLAPADLSGFEVCPKRTAGCTRACLHTAGNPAFMSTKAKARIVRTRAYFEARKAFMLALAGDIQKLQSAAAMAGMRCGVRLNATSDIPWEKVAVEFGGRTYPNIMALFPYVQFYDYTKRANRKNLPRNYTLTFSLAENNDADALAALANGMNVAAVLNVKKGVPLPASYTINDIVWPVIDGDEHDFRPLDPKGVIVGLRPKGKARGDVSGFVRQVV